MYKFHILTFLVLVWVEFSFSGVLAQDSNWTIFNESNSPLPKNYVSDILFDKKGNGWIATWGGGLVFKSSSGDWEVFTQFNSALPNDRINHLALDENGGLWIATDGDGLVRFCNGKWEQINIPDQNIVLTVEVDNSGTAWIGTFNNGLYKYEKSKLNKVWGGENDLAYTVNDILTYENGNILFSSRDMVYELSKNGKVKEILSEEVVYGLEQDEQGAVWAALYPPGRLGKMENGNWNFFEERADKPALNLSYSGNYIHAMLVLEDEVITGSQNEKPLVTFTGKEWRAFQTPYSGYAGMGLSALALDHDGNIWLGSWKHGLMKLSYSLEMPDSVLAAGEKHFDRIIDQQHTVKVTGTNVEIQVWDAHKEDGDIITLALGDKLLLESYTLKRQPKSIFIDLSEYESNSLSMHAENLGKIPPNTAAIKVISNGKSYYFSLKSDLQNSGAIRFIRVYEEK